MCCVCLCFYVCCCCCVCLCCYVCVVVFVTCCHLSLLTTPPPPDDTTILVTGSADTSVKLWDVEHGKDTANLPHRAPVRCVEFAEGDKQFLVVTDQVMKQPATIFVYASDGSKGERIND